MPLENAVRQVDDLDSLLKLLGDELKWPLDPTMPAEETTFEWSADELRLPERAGERLQDGIVRQLRPAVTGQPWGIFLVEFTNGQVYKGALRQVLRGLVPSRRRDPGLQAWQHDNLLFICTTSGCDRFTFAHFRGEKAQRARLATFSWERGDDYIRTLCEYNLPALKWPEDDGADKDAWLKSWAGAFDKEPLTREFFKRFDVALDAVKADLRKFQKLNSADAYSRAQLLLERLIFLYFLQNRGWLDQERSYLLSRLQDHRGAPEEFTYYEKFLEPLFWTLATPPGAAQRLDGIPFLNGGLFDDDEFELSKERKDRNPPLRIRNATFADVFDGLLEAFNFTVTEDTPLDQDVAVDPEMLGKVFESIVLHAEAADPDATAPDKRKATGSYYTPRIVVHFICREALIQYLVNHLPGDGWNKRLRAVFDIEATDGLSQDDLRELRSLLTPEQGTQLRDAVADLKCCDPAVGSGAFPVGLMHELVRLRRLAEAAANGYVDPERKGGTAWLHDTKAHIVENCLYGVDIQQQAIEICRLRLWLTLVVDYDLGLDPFAADRPQFQSALDRISQLPNLEMNFRRGDSLHDHICGVPIYIEPGAAKQHGPIVTEIRELGAKLHRAKQSKAKKKLRLTTLACKLRLSQQVAQEELDKLELRQKPLWEPNKDESRAQKLRRYDEEMERFRAVLDKVQKELKEVDELREDLAAPDFYPRLRRLEGADFDSPFNFAWRLDFPAIFGRDEPGFDIIVGNPPFVTARNPIKRELWRERWKRVCHGKYLLVCPFFDLSFGLLRESGELGFIVSNAFAKREFGRPLVEDFFPTVDLQKVVDCSGLMFPGHGTPTCIVFGCNREPEPKSPIRVAAILPGGGDLRTAPEESPLWQILEERHDQPGYSDARVVVADRTRGDMATWPWNLDTTGLSTKDSIEGSVRLVESLDGQQGVLLYTGADEIYVLPPDMTRRLGIGCEVLRPYVTGEDIRDWTKDSNVHCIFPYAGREKPLDFAKADPTYRYFEAFEGHLSQRIAFGRKPEERGLKWYEYSIVVWPKLARDVMLAYPNVATHANFLVGSPAVIFKEKAPVLVFRQSLGEREHHLLAGLLNSSAALFWLKQVCFNKGAGEDEERDRFEFAGGKVEQLPVPDAIAEALRHAPAADRPGRAKGADEEDGR